MDQVIGTSLAAAALSHDDAGYVRPWLPCCSPPLGLYGVLAYGGPTDEGDWHSAWLWAHCRAKMLRMVLRQGMLLVVIGVAAGVAGALALRSLLAGLLFEVKATDPVTPFRPQRWFDPGGVARVPDTGATRDEGRSPGGAEIRMTDHCQFSV